MSTQELKRGQYEAYYPISKLKMAKDNRSLVVKHAESFKSKLNEYNWMMPVIVSSSGDVIEGHHRIESAKLLGQQTIPAYIIDWVDTNRPKEHLFAIIGLNNGNLSWSPEDYLRVFSTYNNDYKIVYDAFLENSNNISVGNVILAFFGGNKSSFKNGTAEIIDLEFSNYLLNKISPLVSKYKKTKIQAYCIREMIKIGFKVKRDICVMDYLFDKYETLAIQNNAVVSSIGDFKPTMETYLNNFLNKKKE